MIDLRIHRLVISTILLIG